MARLGVPALNREALASSRLALPAVWEATAWLTKPAPGRKRHAPGERGCAWAVPDAPTEQVVLIDVVDKVCQHCPSPLPESVAALWQACAQILTEQRRVQELLDSPEPRTWPGYVQAVERSARTRQQPVRGSLAPLLLDSELAEQAHTVLAAWEELLTRGDQALAAYRDQAPPAAHVLAIAAACDTVAQTEKTENQARELAGALRNGHSRYLNAWSMVRRVWSAAKARGESAAPARQAAMDALAREWDGAEVTDVSVLTAPAHVPADGHTSPAAWANAEFTARWRNRVHRWCDLLEKELHQTGPRETAPQLLLVVGWPLTAPGDEDLAYLAQWPQVGPAVPAERPGDPWRPRREDGECTQAVVLAVPAFAATQAARHTGDVKGRVTPGTSIPAEGPLARPGTPVHAAACTLLRDPLSLRCALTRVHLTSPAGRHTR